jgi:hypothetical protein
MTNEEWKELDDLRKAINDYPASVIPEKMEKFTELFVKSITSMGDPIHIQK